MGSLKKSVTGISTVVFAVPGLFFAYLSYVRYQPTYNELGRYFDGEVVLHTQSIEVYVGVAVFFLLLSGFSLALFKRM